MMTSGSTETSADALRLHHGTLLELRITMVGGSSCTLAKVRVSAKKKSLHEKMMQSSVATTMPGAQLGRMIR